MKESKTKIFLMIIVSLLVITILFSNVGQNFKTSISSYENTLKYYKTINYYSTKSKYYQRCLNLNSSYISKNIRANNFEPLLNKNYVDDWKSNIATIKFPSTLEVLDNDSDVIKKYAYGTDFVENFRGNITSGIVKSKASFESDSNAIHKVLNEILLFDGYNSLYTDESITDIDLKLKSLGASGIISPMFTPNPRLESGFLDRNLPEPKKGKGIAKFIVNVNVFNELKDYATKGYIIKINSGGEVDPIIYKNVYGVIKGKNTNFKPLVIAVFYDGNYKTNSNKLKINKNYSVPSSILLDCMRVVNKQRLRKPDRTIIFAFLSGYYQNKEGLNHFLETYNNENLIVLDGLGLNKAYTIDYNKFSSTLTSSIDYFLEKVGFNIILKNKNIDPTNKYLILSAKNLNFLPIVNLPDSSKIDKSSKFLLSLIQDECYNLNFLSGNIGQFRRFERYVRNNSALLSIIAITFLIWVLFFPIKNKKEN